MQPMVESAKNPGSAVANLLARLDVLRVEFAARKAPRGVPAITARGSSAVFAGPPLSPFPVPTTPVLPPDPGPGAGRIPTTRNRTLYRDYETRSTIDLRKCGAWVYATHPTTEVLCCAYAVDDGPVKLWTPGDPIPPAFIEAANNPDCVVSAFNDNFERQIERHIMSTRYGWPIVPVERHRCTQAQTLAAALPASLGLAAQAMGLDQQKGNARLMLRMAKPRRPRKNENPAGIYWFDDLDRRAGLHSYCAQDVETERELSRRLPPLSESEQALWVLDARINDRGFYTDASLLDGAIRITEKAGASINNELQDLTGISSVNATSQILGWLNENGCELTDLRRKTIKAALADHTHNPTVRRVLEIRQAGAQAAVKKLTRLSRGRSDDARVRGAFRYHGAATGRWSSLGVQVHNLKRPETKDLGAAIEAISNAEPRPLSVVGDISRAIVCAAPGHRLIAADFSGVESRLTAWISGQQSKLDAWITFDRTKNQKDEPYYLVGLQMGVPEDQARTIGKIADLAFGYMGGLGAWRALAPADTSSDNEIKQKQRQWRALHTDTVKCWYALDRSAKAAIASPDTNVSVNDRIAFCYDRTFLWMILPSGRRLAYPMHI
jgi:DNA polymerase bacteriophage-type